MDMPKKKGKPGGITQVIYLVIMAALLSSTSCSLFGIHGAAQPSLREDFSLLAPEDFPQKIKQLEDVSQNGKSVPVRTRALFYLALAHMHYRNPSPDYSRAAQYLDKYIALQSAQRDKSIDELVAWRSVVQTLDNSLREYEKLKKNYAQLKQQYDRANKTTEGLVKKVNELGQVIENQKKELERLKETIKELDAVQQEIEKKKRGIKKSDDPAH
jgi:septal ring factor EnvC (AmiA/AmiB activator)